MFFFDEANFVRNAQDLPMKELFYFLPIGYLVTILVETPVLVAGLSRKLSLKQRVLCGVWLTACTYPIVVLVLPAVFFGSSRLLYLTVAEIFAPAAECVLFYFAFRGSVRGGEMLRCFAVIVLANLASFGLGEVIGYYGWFGLF